MLFRRAAGWRILTLLIFPCCLLCSILQTAFTQKAAKTTLRLRHPRLIIYKSRRLLEAYDGNALAKSYSVALGKVPIGAKRREGDFKTPEGDFILTRKNPRSRYSLSIAINYPNDKAAISGLNEGLLSKAEYRAIFRANRLGVPPPQHTKLGGDVMIHGGGIGEDWTWGCIALQNEDIRELYRALPLKTPVAIKP